MFKGNISQTGIINRCWYVKKDSKRHQEWKASDIMSYIDMDRLDYDTNIEFSYLMYRDVNNLYGQAVWQKLPVDGFKWNKKKSKFTCL